MSARTTAAASPHCGARSACSPEVYAAAPEAALRRVHLVDVHHDRDRALTIESSVPRDAFGTIGARPPGTARLLSRTLR